MTHTTTTTTSTASERMHSSARISQEHIKNSKKRSAHSDSQQIDIGNETKMAKISNFLLNLEGESCNLAIYASQNPKIFETEIR